MFDNRNGLHYSVEDNMVVAFNVRKMSADNVQFSFPRVDDYATIVYLKNKGERISATEFLNVVELHEMQMDFGVPWHVELQTDYLARLDFFSRTYSRTN